MRPHAEHIENHDRHAYGDRRVGDVERPEVVRSPIYVHKVDNRAGREPIEEIPRRSADDEREADAGDSLVQRQACRDSKPTPIRATVAIAAMTVVLKGKSAACRNPKAAPVLRMCVKSSSPGMIVTLAWSGRLSRTIAFVIWSTATTLRGNHSSIRRDLDDAVGGTVRSPMNRLGQGLLASLAESGPRGIT